MIEGILILDFGSQYTQLIARRVRELQVYCEIIPYNKPLEEITHFKVKGFVLSGGPLSVFDKEAPRVDVLALLKKAPVLGICYGMQLLAHALGGEVKPAKHREYGWSEVHWEEPLLEGLERQAVWMSHGDLVEKVPEGAQILAYSQGSGSEASCVAAFRGQGFLGVQFHPEVSHTQKGKEILKAFIDFCGVQTQWSPPQIIPHLIEEIQNQVGGEKVLCALSGGVDSTVAATLLTQALGYNQVRCVFVDNGLLRKNEFQDVLKMYQDLHLNIEGVDASSEFLSRLKGVMDPEKKRKIIGHCFIDVFKSSIKTDQIKFLAQGTLYPDVIESVPMRGQPSVTIKTHHNVGGLPKELDLELVEPLKELFKDEVRAIGRELGLPEKFLRRHPFPGPGLAVRILGPVEEENLKILRDCDAIFMEELEKHHLYDQIWQAFAVLLPVHTVGVQGDFRTYEKVVALRAVTSEDGMTANWYPFTPEVLAQISRRITNEVQGVNRVVYDITSKPPGTIEWE